MSISENVGGVSKYLNNIRTATGYLDLKKGIYNALQGTKRGDNTISRIRRAKSSFKQLVIPGMLFEDMGITYLGPVDGHDITALVATIQAARRVEGPGKATGPRSAIRPDSTARSLSTSRRAFPPTPGRWPITRISSPR